MEGLKLTISPARRHFKQRIGQVNHFLITALIGLDGVKSKVVTLPEQFRTSWNPKSVERSVERSVRFILDASLSWVVDNLDSYFIELLRKPSLIENEDLRNNCNGAGRSVNNKFEVFFQETREYDTEVCKYAALVALAIQWRNNKVHYGANNALDAEYRALLDQYKSFYIDDFRHLDVDQMLKSFDSRNGSPSFKEVTSMINAIHKYVECVDNHLLKSLNFERYKSDILEEHYAKCMLAKRKLNNLADERKEAYLKTMFRQYGFEVEE